MPDQQEPVQEAPTRWPSGSLDLLRDVMVAWGGWLGELSAIEHRQARADYALDLADFERRVRQDERERALR
jgi:hypothetical protein